MVGGGGTSIACSISVVTTSQRGERKREQSGTSERFELEGFYFGDDVFVLVRGEVVVLDEMDDVGEGKHSGEALGGGIV